MSVGFEALVQSQEDFATEFEALRIYSLGAPLGFERPSDAQVAARSDSDIAKGLTQKLARAYPKDQPQTIEQRAASHIRAHLIRAVEEAIAFVEKHAFGGADIGNIRRRERWSIPRLRSARRW